MELLTTIFNEALYRPLLNGLVLLYAYLPGKDFGIAIIVLTVIIKFIFYPLGAKAIKSQKDLATLQPKIKELQEKYKDDKEKQSREIMDLYKREKINPLSGCLPLLIQLPVLIAMYRVFWNGLDPEQLSLLYGFVPFTGEINHMFLGIINLSNPNIIFAILVGIFQFFQIKMISAKKSKKGGTDGFQEKFQKQTQYFMPVFIVLILWRLPAALGLYILTTTIFTIAQQYFMMKKNHAGAK